MKRYRYQITKMQSFNSKKKKKKAILKFPCYHAQWMWIYINNKLTGANNIKRPGYKQKFDKKFQHQKKRHLSLIFSYASSLYIKFSQINKRDVRQGYFDCL